MLLIVQGSISINQGFKELGIKEFEHRSEVTVQASVHMYSLYSVIPLSLLDNVQKTFSRGHYNGFNQVQIDNTDFWGEMRADLT